jgi:hypothetical protein
MDINQSRSVSLDDAVPLLTGDPLTTATATKPGAADAEVLRR